VVPVSSILGRIPVVPVSETGTIPFDMCKEAEDFLGAPFDSKKGADDGSRWWCCEKRKTCYEIYD
jgi:hypothetical protein